MPLYQKDAPSTIQSMFNSIAGRYDRTNAILSFSFHKLWNRALVREMLQHRSSPHVLIDLCAGTGDIAYEYLKRVKAPCHAHFIDFSPQMLEIAQRKRAAKHIATNHQLTLLEADVQKLPLPDSFADLATIAYGIRNVRDPSKCVEEVFRVLKPGGLFGILELTRPTFPPLRLGHQFYLQHILPLVGKWTTQNGQAYHYLQQSIENFIEPNAMEGLLLKQGFRETKVRSLTGGIASLIIGRKPS